VAAGASVAGAEVAAGGASVAAGAQDASIMEANTSRLTNDHNSDFLFILSFSSYFFDVIFK
jgi:hypothetical protein